MEIERIITLAGAVLGGMTIVITNIASYLSTRKVGEITGKYHEQVTEYHHEVNSKMDKLLEYVRAEGVAEGKKRAEDEQARRNAIEDKP